MFTKKSIRNKTNNRRQSRSNEGFFLNEINYFDTIQTPWRPQLPLPKEVSSSSVYQKDNFKNYPMDKQSNKSSSSIASGNHQKKWSLGRFFKNKKQQKTDEIDSSSDEDRRAGFLSTQKLNSNKKDKRKRSSKLLGSGFDHIVLNPRENDFLIEIEQVPQSNQSRSTNSLDRRAMRKERKKMQQPPVNNIQQHHTSSEDDKLSFESPRHRSDESLVNIGLNANGSNRKSRAARTERYYKRMSRDSEMSTGSVPLHVQQKISQSNVWKNGSNNFDFNENIPKYDQSKYQGYNLKNSTSMSNVPISYNLCTKPQSIKPDFRINQQTYSQNSINNNKRSVSYDNNIYLDNKPVLSQILVGQPNIKEQTPPPPPPRDPQRKVHIGSSHNELRPLSYAFDKNNLPVNAIKNKCISNDQLYNFKGSTTNSFENSMKRASSNQPVPLSISPGSNLLLNQKRYITRDRIQPQPQDFHYVADATPRSRKPIHIVSQKQQINNDSPIISAKLSVQSPIRTTKEGILTNSASDFWKKIDKEESKRQSRNLELNKADRIRSMSSSKINDLYKQNINFDEIDGVVNGSLLIKRGANNNDHDQQQPNSYINNSKSKTMPNYMQKATSNENCIKMPLGNKYDEYVSKQRKNLSIFEPTNAMEFQGHAGIVPPEPPRRKTMDTYESYSKNPTNLEDAINELEEIYKSLRFGDSDSLDRADCRDIPTPTNFDKYAEEYDDDSSDCKEPDVVLDDVALRNLKYANTKIKTIENQPPFGIPVGPVSLSPRTDYLHVDPATHNKKIRYSVQNYPDLVTDDLAVRTLRKDQLDQPKSQIMQSYNSMKKKRAQRTQSANIYALIQRDAAKPSGGNLLDYYELDKPTGETDRNRNLKKNSSTNDIPTTLQLLRNLKTLDSPSKKEIFRHPSQGGAVFNLPSALKANEDKSNQLLKQPIPLPRRSLSPESIRSNSKMEEMLNQIAREAKESSEKLSQDLIKLRQEVLITTVQHDENKQNLIDIENVSNAAKHYEKILLDVVPPQQESIIEVITPTRELKEGKLINEIEETSKNANRICEKLFNDIIKTEPPVVVHEAVKVKNYSNIELPTATHKKESNDGNNVVVSLIKKLDPSSERIGEIAARCMRQISELGDFKATNSDADYDNINENLKGIIACNAENNNNSNDKMPENFFIAENKNDISYKTFNNTNINNKGEDEEIDKIMKECEDKAIADSKKNLKPLQSKLNTIIASDEFRNSDDAHSRKHDDSGSHHSTDGGIDHVEGIILTPFSSSSDCIKSSSPTSKKHESSSITSINCFSSSDYIKSPSSEFNPPSTDPIKTFSTTSYDLESSSTPNLINLSSEDDNYTTPSPPPLNLTPIGNEVLILSNIISPSEKTNIHNNNNDNKDTEINSQYSSREELAMIFGIKNSPSKTGFNSESVSPSPLLIDLIDNKLATANKTCRPEQLQLNSKDLNINYKSVYNTPSIISLDNNKEKKFPIINSKSISNIELLSSTNNLIDLNTDLSNTVNSKKLDSIKILKSNSISPSKELLTNRRKCSINHKNRIVKLRSDSQPISALYSIICKENQYQETDLHNMNNKKLNTDEYDIENNEENKNINSKYKTVCYLPNDNSSFIPVSKNSINTANITQEFPKNYNNIKSQSISLKNHSSIPSISSSSSSNIEKLPSDLKNFNNEFNDNITGNGSEDNSIEMNQNLSYENELGNRRYIKRETSSNNSDSSLSSNTMLSSRIPCSVKSDDSVANKIRIQSPIKNASSAVRSSSSPSPLNSPSSACKISNRNLSQLYQSNSLSFGNSNNEQYKQRYNNILKDTKENNNDHIDESCAENSRIQCTPKKLNLSNNYVRPTKASRLRIAASDKKKDSNDSTSSFSPSPVQSPRQFKYNRNFSLENNQADSIRKRLEIINSPIKQFCPNDNSDSSKSIEFLKEAKIKLVPSISVSLKQTLNEVSFNANRDITKNDNANNFDGTTACIDCVNQQEDLIDLEQSESTSNVSSNNIHLIESNDTTETSISPRIEDRDKSSKRKSNLNRAYNEELIKDDPAVRRRRGRRGAGMVKQIIPRDDNLSTAIRDVLNPIKAEQKQNEIFNVDSFEQLKINERIKSASPELNVTKSEKKLNLKHENVLTEPFNINLKFSCNNSIKSISSDKLNEVPYSSSYHDDIESLGKKRFYQRRVDKINERTKSDLAEIQKITAKCRSLTPGIDLKSEEIILKERETTQRDKRRYFTYNFGDTKFMNNDLNNKCESSSNDNGNYSDLNQRNPLDNTSSQSNFSIVESNNRRKSSDDHSSSSNATNPIVSILKKKDAGESSSPSIASPVTFSSNTVDTPTRSYKRQGILKKRSSLDESRYLSSRSHSPDDRNSILIKSSLRNSLEEINRHQPGILKQRSYECKSDGCCPTAEPQHGILKKKDSPSDSANGTLIKHVSISQAVILAAAELCNDIILDHGSGNTSLDYFSGNEYDQIKPILKSQDTQEAYIAQGNQSHTPKPILKKKSSQETEEIRPILKTSRKSSRDESSLEYFGNIDDQQPQKPILKNSNHSSPIKRLSLALEPFEKSNGAILQRSHSLENPYEQDDLYVNLDSPTADKPSISVADRIKFMEKIMQSSSPEPNSPISNQIQRPHIIRRRGVARNRFQTQPITNDELLQTEKLDLIKTNSLTTINHHINSKFSPVNNNWKKSSDFKLDKSSPSIQETSKSKFDYNNLQLFNISGIDNCSITNMSTDKSINDLSLTKTEDINDESSCNSTSIVNNTPNEDNSIQNENDEDIGKLITPKKLNLAKSKSGCVPLLPSDLTNELKNRLKKSSSSIKPSSFLRNSPKMYNESPDNSKLQKLLSKESTGKQSPQTDLAKILCAGLKNKNDNLKSPQHDDTINLVRNLSTLGSGIKSVLEDVSTTSEGESSGGAEINTILKNSSTGRRQRFSEGSNVAKSKSYSSILDDTNNAQIISINNNNNSTKNYESYNAPIMRPDKNPISKSSSIADRLALLQKNGEESWRKRIIKRDELDDINNSAPLSRTNSSDSETSKVADRLDKLKTSSEKWKNRVEPSDASKFTVAGKLQEKPDIKLPFKRYESRKPNMETLMGSTNLSFDSLNQSGTESSEDSISFETFSEENQGKILQDKNIVYSEVLIPKLDDEETFSNFFANNKSLKNSGLEEEPLPNVSDFDTIVSTERLTNKKKIQRPGKRMALAKNPLKALAARDDIQMKYTETTENTAVKEIAQRKKEIFNVTTLAAEAIAALKSVEDYKAINLKSCSSRVDKPWLPYYNQAAMLLHIKGRTHVQTRLVEPSYKSINHGDCFLLVTQYKLYRYVGSLSNVIESNRSQKISAYIFEKKDLGCKALTEILLIDGKDSSYWDEFWSLLKKPSDYIIPDSGHPDEDEIFESSLIETNKIYEFSNNMLLPLEHYWGALPKLEMLDAKKILVFDFGSEMYVWSGKKASLVNKRACIALAKENFSNKVDYTNCYLNPSNFSSICGNRASYDFEKETLRNSDWCLLGKITQNMETCLFKEKFADWPDYAREDLVKDYLLNNVNSIKSISGNMLYNGEPYEEPNLILENSCLGRGSFYYDEDTKRHFDILTQSVAKWKINEYNYKDLKTNLDHFYTADSYIVKWSYQINVAVRELSGNISTRTAVGRDRTAFFCWQGEDSSKNEKGAAALLTVELDKEKGAQVLVSHGEETPVFVRLFKTLFLHKGNRDDCLKKRSEWRLFLLINGLDECETILKEIDCRAEKLRSQGSFYVIHGEKGLIYVWHGQNSPKYIKTICKTVADNIQKAKSEEIFYSNSDIQIIEMNQGEQNNEFSDIFENNLIDHLNDSKIIVEYTPRIFHFSSTEGVFNAKELYYNMRSKFPSPFPFTQDQLYNAPQPAIFMIDCSSVLWIWIGWWPVDSINVLDKENGNTSNENRAGINRWIVERKATLTTAIDYWKAKTGKTGITDNDSLLSNLKGYVVWAGLESSEFISMFPDWKFREDIQAINIKDNRPDKATTILDELSKLTKTKYPLGVLKARPLPEGIDPCKIELYIIESDYYEALGMEKSEFDQLPIWKQTSVKKQHGLF